MSKLPKRVWSGKKLVFSGKKAVREKDGQIGVYKPQFEEIDSGEVYDKKRETLDPGAPLDIYDSSKPEYIGTMEDGILATYTFYNYNGSVLKQDTCKDGETPIPPADPTRDSDWEYDYQFAGWNPAVGPIEKDTDYVASFNETKRIYTVYVSVNDSDYGSLDLTELTVEAGTEILDSSLEPTLSPNQLMVGSTVVTATANAGYEFDYWTNWSQIITQDQYPQAVFKVATPIVDNKFRIEAAEANVDVELSRWSGGTAVDLSFETSTDGSTRSDYTLGDTINLANIGDCVYIRNKSETVTGFTETSYSGTYHFTMSGMCKALGNIGYLLCKNDSTTVADPQYEGSTFAVLFKDCPIIQAPNLNVTTMSVYCYNLMFQNCTSLVSAPALPATTLKTSCYSGMFNGCTSLVNIPALNAAELPKKCYYQMFRGCSSLKVSTTSGGDYITAYPLPYSGTITSEQSDSCQDMFMGTGGDFVSGPTTNTTYYINGSVIS